VKHDIPYLVDYFLQQDAVNPVPRIESVSRPALEKLLEHDYPGNVRELETVLASAVHSARQARAQVVCAKDVIFGETTLPRKDEILAFIVPAQPGDNRLLLLWSPSWATWFFPTRPVRHETAEVTLRSELSERLGLEAGDYEVVPLSDPAHIRLIDYSRREQKMKHYDFRPVLVRVAEQAERRLDARPTARWVELGGDGALGGALDVHLLSPTLRTPVFASALSRLRRTLAPGG
jgi:sulfur relay (sulfurtransferase) DsrF/TusC family protein